MKTKHDFVLDVRKLNMLAELDRLGTIAAVAETLRLTAPGISMQLASLEREIGVKLTEKQGRRIVLTPAGRLLARHGSGIVDMLTIAEMEVASIRRGSTGTYRVAAFPTAARAILPDAWKTLAVGDPGLQLRLVELEPSDALPALAAGEVELAVAHHYSNMPPLTATGLIVTPIGSERVDLAVRADDLPAGTGDRYSLDRFADHDWILPSREWSCFDMVHRATDLAGFEPRGVAEATDYSVQLALVAAGVGVALIPRLGAQDIPENVTMIPLDAAILRHVVLVSRRASAADAGLNRIMSAISASAANTLAAEGLPHGAS